MRIKNHSIKFLVNLSKEEVKKMDEIPPNKISHALLQVDRFLSWDYPYNDTIVIEVQARNVTKSKQQVKALINKLIKGE
jgi:hypothetical protein